MILNRVLYLSLLYAFLSLSLPAAAATVDALWNTATDVPVAASSYTATGNTVNFTLNFAPATGTNLTVVNNTGLPFISGTFDNLAQGQAVTLSYGGVTYNYVAYYFGGTGNDLVLVWANSRAFAWGYNNDGKIGDGSTTQRNVMVPVTMTGVLSGKTIISLAQGTYHSLALCSDGTLASWGINTTGQLGDNSTTSRSVPVAVNAESGVSALHGKTVVAVAANFSNSMALCSDGTIAAWGYNNSGQLGNTTMTQSNVPVAVTAADGVSALSGRTAVAIAAGYNHSMALCSDGTVVTWGSNFYGQLGDTTTPKFNVSTTVNNTSGVSALFGKSVVAIAAGDNHSLALCSDGTVATWGYNTYGQLGDNTTTQRTVPVAVNNTSGVSALFGKSVVAIAAGQGHSMALCSDGTVATWGYGYYGQRGDNTSTSIARVPVAVNTDDGVSALHGKFVVAISDGGSSGYSCSALCADGSMATWGYNAGGDLGNNSTTNSRVPVALNTGPLVAGERLVSPSNISTTTQAMVLVAEPLPGATTLAATVLSGSSAVLNGVVSSYDTVNVSFDYGTTAAYSSSIAATPATITGYPPAAVTATLTGLMPLTTYHFRVNDGVHTGDDLTFTTPNDDTSLASLVNSAGSLSPAFSSGTTSYVTPSVLESTASITLTPALSDSNATMTVNGVSAASGSPFLVSLGHGTNIFRLQVTAQDGVTKQTYTLSVDRPLPAVIDASYASGSDVPLASNALISATGSSVNFTLNYTPATGTNLMVVNNTGLSFINGTFDNLMQGQAVALSYGGVTYHFVANYYGGTGNDLVLVWANNRAFAWGYNASGEVGDGTTTHRHLPTAADASGVLAGKTLVATAAGAYHALALCSDGTVAAWGRNNSGQLGNNSTLNSSVPVVVNTDAGVSALAGKTVVAIAAGDYHSLALCSDGSLVAWGNNATGQLGNNTTIDSSVPVAVSTESDVSALAGKVVAAIATGGYTSMALCTDGTVAAWGDNDFGQLGDNSMTQRKAPVSVNTESGVSALHGKTVVALAACSFHSLALCADGTVAAWGYNNYGELGDNTTIQRTAPVNVNTDSGVSALAGKTVVALTTGQYHSLALCEDGTVAAWGYNNFGQLGDTTVSQRRAPVSVNTDSGVSALAGKAVVALAAGTYHSLALCSDGTLTAWGSNSYGEIGNDSTTRQNLPVLLNTRLMATGEMFNMLASSHDTNYWSLAVAAAPAYATVGTQEAAGIGGTSTTLNGLVVAAYDSMAVSFEYGTTSSYGTTQSAVPASVSNGAVTPVNAVLTELIPGTTYHFRVTGTNSVSTLQGDDLTFTTLNNNANLASLVVDSGTLSPAFASSTTSYALSVPYETPAIILTPGQAAPHSSIQINGVQASSAAATWPIPLLEGINTINVFVTAEDGTTTQTYTLTVTRGTGPSLASLGLDSGTLSPGFDPNTTRYTASVSSATSAITLTPTVVDGTTTVQVNGIAVTSGDASSPISLVHGDTLITTAVTSQDGTVTKTYTVLVSRDIPATFAAALDSASTVPLTIYGLTATGRTLNVTLNYTPVTGASLLLINNTSAGFISGMFDNLAQGQLVALGYNGVSYHFRVNYFGGNGNDLVLQWADSRAFAWGSNSYFQLGTQGSFIGPVPVTTASGALGQRSVQLLATGGQHCLALCWDGSLTAWGYNTTGQLGTGVITAAEPAPSIVDTVSDTSALKDKSVVAMSAGSSHTLALCSDGTVSAWGFNYHGQVGVSPIGSDAYPTPMAVDTTSGISALDGKTVTAIASGYSHNLALCSDGTLAAWGYNAAGQLGNGSYEDSQIPVAVNASAGVSALYGKTVVAVAANGNHSLALCSDGTLLAWGSNNNGQLGDNSTRSRLVPVAVNSASGVSALYGKTVVAVAAGSFHSMALCSDGTVAAWGYNNSGQLGDNSTAQRNVPVKVVDLNIYSSLYGKTVTGISAGNNFSLAFCSDGTLSGWGLNSSGQLGAPQNIISQKTPRQITSDYDTDAELFASTPSAGSSHSLVLVATPPATASTLAATELTSSGATLNGVVNANNGYVPVFYDYGITTAYGLSQVGSPFSVTGTTPQDTSVTLTDLSPATTYHFRANGGSYSGSDLTFTTLSLLQGWRQNSFGTTANSGTTADDADYDHDGIPNLIEWACRLDPAKSNALPITTVNNGANFEYSYSRSTAAVAVGATFTVEWSDTLAAGSWSSSGVTQTVLSDDGTTQQIKAVIPVQAATAKFVRLAVTAPQ